MCLLMRYLGYALFKMWMHNGLRNLRVVKRNSWRACARAWRPSLPCRTRVLTPVCYLVMGFSFVLICCSRLSVEQDSRGLLRHLTSSLCIVVVVLTSMFLHSSFTLVHYPAHLLLLLSRTFCTFITTCCILYRVFRLVWTKLI